MNYSQGLQTIEPIIIEQKENLTTWGIFLSSLILSISGAISVIMGSLKESRCTQIKNCCGMSCTRKVIDPDVPTP